MKVLQISHRHFIAGGSDAMFFATTDLLRQAGHLVVPFCMKDSRNEPSAFEPYFAQGADTTKPSAGDTLRYFWNSDAVEKLTKLIREQGPFDVAHLHIYHGKQTPAILHVLKRFGIKIVQSLHEYKLACPVYTMQRDGAPCDLCVSGSSAHAIRHRCKDGSLLKSTVMWAESKTARMLGDVRLIDRFLCVSDFQRRVMARGGIDPAKLRVLHNFVADQGHESTKGDYLLYIGRIDPTKGIETLVDAAMKANKKLVVAGEGPWQAQLNEAIQDQPNISYVGFKSGAALNDLIRNSLAVVVPSEWNENCPMSVLEAKAMGKPVIASRIGGIPELVNDGVDGFLFSAGDKADLARAIGRLDNCDYSAICQAALDDTNNRFDGTNYLAKLEAHYRAVLQPKGGTSTKFTPKFGRAPVHQHVTGTAMPSHMISAGRSR